MARLGGKDRGLFTRRMPDGTIRWCHQSHVNTRSAPQSPSPQPALASRVGCDFLACTDALSTPSLPFHRLASRLSPHRACSWPLLTASLPNPSSYFRCCCARVISHILTNRSLVYSHNRGWLVRRRRITGRPNCLWAYVTLLPSLYPNRLAIAWAPQ